MLSQSQMPLFLCFSIFSNHLCLLFLQKKLEDVEVISAAEVPTDEIRFGTWVKITTENEITKSFQIVGPDEMDSSGKKVTFTSPLGRAFRVTLLLKGANAVLEIIGPAGLIFEQLVAPQRIFRHAGGDSGHAHGKMLP